MKQLVLMVAFIGSIGTALLGHSHPMLPGGDAELPVKELTAAELDSMLLNPRSGKPQFIPEAVLAHEDLVELMPAAHDRQRFLNRYEAERTPRLVMDPQGRMPYATCREFEERTTEGVGFSPERLEEILVESDIVLTGRVVEAVPGWNVGSMRVTTLVKIGVTEILKASEAQPLSHEKPLRFINRGGRLSYRGVAICDDVQFFDIKEGEEILVAGDLDSDYPRMLITVVFFPLRGDDVIMKATAGTRSPALATTLSRLKGAVERYEAPPQ